MVDKSEAAATQLQGPPCPPELHYLVGWFDELSNARTGSGFGPNAIAWTEIEAWARSAGIRLTTFERQALRRLDLEYLRAAAEKKT